VNSLDICWLGGLVVGCCVFEERVGDRLDFEQYDGWRYVMHRLGQGSCNHQTREYRFPRRWL
jgi:hypothetical protein